MIAFVRGDIADISEGKIIIDTGSIGYEVNVPMSVLGSLYVGQEDVTVFTHMVVKEDDMSLFGFLDRDMLSMFRLLITVSGIGPKGALSILSVLSPDDIRFAVLSSDSKTISRAPGIGAKTAARMIIELKDKVSFEDSFGKKEQTFDSVNAPAENGDARSEAVTALTVLGYSNSEALKAIRGLDTAGKTTEEILKLALKNLTR